MCCVVAVLTLVIVVSFVVCLCVVGCLSSDEQGGVAYISGTGKFSAEHCTFSGNTADVSPAARALLRVTARFLSHWMLLRCCVTDVLRCRGADARDCCVVCCLFVCCRVWAWLCVGHRRGWRHLGSE